MQTGSHSHSKAHSHSHSHSGPWSESLPARRKADLADPSGSLDPSDSLWSQWRSAALIARGPARIARFVIDAIGPKAQDVLEVGCGSGYLALELARAGHRVVGLDPGPEGIDLARRTLSLCQGQGAAPDLEYRQEEFMAWDDAGQEFDALVFNLSLHHIADLDAAVAKTRRLLRPGGRVVINDFAFDRLDDRTAAWLADLETAMSLAAGDTDVPDPAASRAALAERIADSATKHELHGFEPLIKGLRGTFDQTHFSWEPFMYTRIANRAAGLPQERHDRLVPFLADLECLQFEQGAIQAVCYRFLGTRR